MKESENRQGHHPITPSSQQVSLRRARAVSATGIGSDQSRCLAKQAKRASSFLYAFRKCTILSQMASLGGHCLVFARCEIGPDQAPTTRNFVVDSARKKRRHFRF